MTSDSHATPSGCRRLGTSRRVARAFSIVEMLVALMITASLLAATLVAFDAAWRGYKQTTESASTHVVSRIVMHRILALVRTGTDFGPYPEDVLDPDQNPLTTDAFEFISETDRLAGNNVITRIERREGEEEDKFELWYTRVNAADDQIIEEFPLIRDVREAIFILEYEPGPRLKQATIDLTIEPNDYEDTRIGLPTETPIIRLVASSTPRQFE